VSEEYKATIMVLMQYLPVSTVFCTSSTSYPSSEVKWKSCQIGMAIRNVDSNHYPKLGGQRPTPAGICQQMLHIHLTLMLRCAAGSNIKQKITASVCRDLLLFQY